MFDSFIHFWRLIDMRTMYYSPRRTRRETRLEENVYVPVNVSGNDDEFVISAYVPGIKAEDLQIEVLEDSVSIEGEFVMPEDESMSLYRQEQPTGRFHRSLHLRSQLDAAKVEATVKDGVLSLRVPKAEEAKTRKISVKAS